MNYRLRYWHELFENLIKMHMVEGNHFDFEYGDCMGSWVKCKRMDYLSNTPGPFLKYEFHFEGTSVVYSVDNQPEGGTKLTLVSIAEKGGYLRVIDASRDPENERIMRDAYLFAVKMFDSFWFD